METTEFSKKLGQRIRTLRVSKGLSQEKLAEKAGLHPTYVSEIELGKANASISIFARLSDGLGMMLSELVEVEGREEDIAIIDFVSQIRALDERQRKVYLETAAAVLKGMKEF
jgi:transcriptional regulator with XRE-family HTH domain